MSWQRMPAPARHTKWRPNAASSVMLRELAGSMWRSLMRAGTCASADLSGEQHGQGSHHEQHTDHRECVAEPPNASLNPMISAWRRTTLPIATSALCRAVTASDVPCARK